MFLKQCQTILRYGLGSQGGCLTRKRRSLARKLLLTGFLAMHVRASVELPMSGDVQWTTNAQKWEDRWIFLHRADKDSDVTLFRFEKPSRPHEVEVQGPEGASKVDVRSYVTSQPSFDKCNEVLALELGVCSGTAVDAASTPHTKTACDEGKKRLDPSRLGRYNIFKGIFFKDAAHGDWRALMKVIDMTPNEQSTLGSGTLKNLAGETFISTWLRTGEEDEKCDGHKEQNASYSPFSGQPGAMAKLPVLEPRCDLSFQKFTNGKEKIRCLQFVDRDQAKWKKAFEDCGIKPRTRRRRLKTPFEKLVDEIDSLSEK